MLNLVWPLWF